MSREKMLQARSLIQTKHFTEARAILKTVDHPTARQWIAKLDEIEMAQELGDPFANLTPSRPAVSGDHLAAGRQLLQEAVAVFSEQDWDVKVQMQEMAQLEKRQGVEALGVIILTVFFGLIGTLIVILVMATAKVTRVTLQLLPDGTVKASAPRGTVTVDEDLEEMKLWAESVTSGGSYATAIVFGLLSTALWWFIFGKIRLF